MIYRITFLIFLFFIFSSFGRGSCMDIYKDLSSVPIWGQIGEGAEGEKQLEELALVFERVSKCSIGEIRENVAAWLREEIEDQVQFSYRIDNARILCVFVYDLNKNHDYLDYFSDVDGKLRIRRPDFLSDLNAGRMDPEAGIASFLSEFDKLAEMEDRAK